MIGYAFADTSRSKNKRTNAHLHLGLQLSLLNLVLEAMRLRGLDEHVFCLVERIVTMFDGMDVSREFVLVSARSLETTSFPRRRRPEP
jgi:hypothetical protein